MGVQHGASGLWRGRHRHRDSGHRLWHLFFEEIEKNQLPMKSFRKILIAAAALAPSPLFACAACYGKSDSPLASGMNWGIFTLMGVILTVLTCITLFFVHVIRGEQAQIEAENNPPPQNPPTV